jgi:hypothetical protein
VLVLVFDMTVTYWTRYVSVGEVDHSDRRLEAVEARGLWRRRLGDVIQQLGQRLEPGESRNAPGGHLLREQRQTLAQRQEALVVYHTPSLACWAITACTQRSRSAWSRVRVSTTDQCTCRPRKATSW